MSTEKTKATSLFRCIRCGCTDDDCSECVKALGHPCHWVFPNGCSRCFLPNGMPIEPKPDENWTQRSTFLRELFDELANRSKFI